MQLCYNETRNASAMNTPVNREKIQNVIKKVKACIDTDNYRFSDHGYERKIERYAALPDILKVLRNGYHEKQKDEWKPEFNAWNYAIRGKAIDGNELRIAVSFEENGLLIVTVIRLKRFI